MPCSACANARRRTKPYTPLSAKSDAKAKATTQRAKAVDTVKKEQERQAAARKEQEGRSPQGTRTSSGSPQGTRTARKICAGTSRAAASTQPGYSMAKSNGYGATKSDRSGSAMQGAELHG